MTNTSKQIAYGYPSSILATRRGYAKEGCYIIETVASGLVTDDPRTFSTVKKAEDAAETINMPWRESYKRWPLPNSRFASA